MPKASSYKTRETLGLQLKDLSYITLVNHTVQICSNSLQISNMYMKQRFSNSACSARIFHSYETETHRKDRKLTHTENLSL